MTSLYGLHGHHVVDLQVQILVAERFFQGQQRFIDGGARLRNAQAQTKDARYQTAAVSDGGAVCHASGARDSTHRTNLALLDAGELLQSHFDALADLLFKLPEQHK